MTDRCKLCGGNAGRLAEEHPARGTHNLCYALSLLGLPTPNLGERCTDCNGVGRHPKSTYGPINPNQAAIDAWAPACKTCNGKGYTK